MDRGVWQAIVHGVAGADRTEHAHTEHRAVLLILELSSRDSENGSGMWPSDGIKSSARTALLHSGWDCLISGADGRTSLQGPQLGWSSRFATSWLG